MTDDATVVLGAAEGTGAEIAWVVVYVLCWFFVIFPFVLWYFGVRTPRAVRETERSGATTAPSPDVEEQDDRARIAG
jgi:hypothetical protein